MQKKCDYCSQWIDDSVEFCPHCGASNANFKRMVSGTPKTIEELQAWYRQKKLPPESTTRFFIGKDIKEPRAFGIYKDGNGDFVVYKNKSDGSRAIRYQGKDEGYAVNEIYLKLKAEILNQKTNQPTQRSSPTIRRTKRRGGGFTGAILMFLMWTAVVVTVIMFSEASSKRTGYYRINNTPHYYSSSWNQWYAYDDYDDDWYEVEYVVPNNEFWDTKIENFESNWDGASITSSQDYQDDKEYYDSNHSDTDDDFNWSSSDSWDSGGTDWDSDW